MTQSIARLVRAGHSLQAIQEYTHGQFRVFLDAVDQITAQERVNFVTDISSIVASMYSEDGPIKEHMDLLQDTTRGVK